MAIFPPCVSQGISTRHRSTKVNEMTTSPAESGLPNAQVIRGDFRLDEAVIKGVLGAHHNCPIADLDPWGLTLQHTALPAGTRVLSVDR